MISDNAAQQTKNTNVTVCVFDDDRERIADIRSALAIAQIDIWATSSISEFTDRISGTRLVLAYDKKDIPAILIEAIDVQQPLIPLCAYSAEHNLLQVIQTVKQGAVDYFWLPFEEDFAERVLLAFDEIYHPPPKEKQDALGLQKLSKRQHEVAEYVSRGMTTEDIAQTLGISTRTAENHVQNIFTKLGINDRAALIRAKNAP